MTGNRIGRARPRGSRRLVLATVVVLATGLATGLAGCGGDKDHPGISAAATASAAAVEFGAAYDAFQAEFKAGTALASGEEATLAQRTAAVRAVRTAFFHLDAAVRKIDVPAAAADEVDALYAAIAALVKQFDVQGAARTVAEYRAQNDASAAAFEAADTAITKVREVLGVDNASPSSGPGEPTSTQQPVSAPYLRGKAVQDAAAWRDDLLEIGVANATADAGTSTSAGVVEAWMAAFPDVLADSGVVGDLVEAPRNGISGFTLYGRDDKDVSGPDNPDFLAFAVRDASGTCAGGVISGYPVIGTAKAVAVPKGAPCTGHQAAVEAGFRTS